MVRNEPVEPVNTSDDVEIKVCDDEVVDFNKTGQSQEMTMYEQACIELNTKRDYLMSCKEMICVNIASNIRLSDIESISDWVDRISKDIIAWRDVLEYNESEIAKINTELSLISRVQLLNKTLNTYLVKEMAAMESLRSIQANSASIKAKIHEAGRELNELRGLPNTPTIKNLPSENYADEGSFESAECCVINWKPWCDGIELAVGYEHVPVYAGYGRCTKCDTHVPGGELHECKFKTECIIKQPANHPLTDITQPQLNGTSDKPKLCPITRECPQHDIFLASGQSHY